MRITYIRVQPGEHLSMIADLFGTTREAILRANGLGGPEDVRPGMVLVIVPGEGSKIETPVRADPPVTARDPGPVPAGPAAVQPVSRGPAAALQPVPRGPAAARPVQAQEPVRAPVPVHVKRRGRPASPPGVITQGPGSRKVVALTFETSFGAGRTAAILECMRRHRAKATWFLSGDWADRFPGLAREVVRGGHQIELHGYGHQHLRELSPGQIRGEIERAASAVQAVTGNKPRYLRPPFGSVSPAVCRVAGDLGYRLVLWSVDSLDWQNPGVAEIVARVREGAHPGAIVLMHATADQAPAALEKIIPGLRVAGYELVTLDEALAG